MNILVVEDDLMLGMAIKFKLEEDGHHVFVASDGEKAMEIAKEGKFDLVVCDIMLPGISGVHFLQMLQNVFANDVPIIIISSIEDSKAMLKKSNVNILDFLLKPLKIEELVDRVKKLTIEKNS